MSGTGGPRGPGSHRSGRRGRRSGTEPLTARSPLRLRAVLSAIALLVAAAAAIAFAVIATARGDGAHGTGRAWTAAGLCAAVAVIAAIDLVVIARRSRH